MNKSTTYPIADPNSDRFCMANIWEDGLGFYGWSTPNGSECCGGCTWEQAIGAATEAQYPLWDEKRGALKMVCAWCGQVMIEGPEHPVSHGICPDCLDKLKKQINKGEK